MKERPICLGKRSCTVTYRAVEGALRHPDGSPDIAAYGRIAHRERDAAVVAAVQDTARSLRRDVVGDLACLVGRRSGRIRSNAPLRG